MIPENCALFEVVIQQSSPYFGFLFSVVMPRAAKSSTARVKLYVFELPDELQATTRGELFCKLCGAIVAHDRRSTVLKHRKGAKHMARKLASHTKQTVWKPSSTVATHVEFLNKVTRTFLSADMPKQSGGERAV